MKKKHETFTDEIRRAVDACGMSRYRISKELGVAESTLSRFMNGKRWLGEDKLNALAELLDLHIGQVPPAKGRKE